MRGAVERVGATTGDVTGAAAAAGTATDDAAAAAAVTGRGDAAVAVGEMMSARLPERAHPRCLPSLRCLVSTKGGCLA